MSDSNNLSYRANTILGVLLIASFLIICALAAIDNLTDVFGKDTYKVKAYYTNIGLLKIGAPVQIGGVVIGKVTEIQMTPDDRVLVVAELYLRKPIPVNSLMGVNATTVSGDTFINLIRGNSDIDIKQTTDFSKAPVLRGLDFFSISNISMMANTITSLLQQSIDDVNLIFGRGRPVDIHASAIRKRIPALKKEYDSIVNHFRDNADLYKGVSEDIQRFIKKTENVRNKVVAAFPIPEMDRLKQKITAISENVDSLQKVADERKDELDQITVSMNRVMDWSKSVKYSKCSVVGVILRDDDCGATRTVSVIKESINKVMDFSLIKKLAYYIKARNIASDFFDDVDADELSSQELYRKWIIHAARQKQKFGAVCSGVDNE